MPHSHGGDRLSKLGDGVLGHILSFLPAKEAARTAVLSSRWRDAFAGVHTVSLEEPEGPIPNYDDRGCDSPGCCWGHPHDPNPPLPFTSAVTAALLARHRLPAAAPLRALRVAMGEYCGGDSFTVDQWVSYAVKQAAPELEIELRLRPVPVCCRPDSLRGSEEHALRVVPDVEVYRSPAARPSIRIPPGVDDDDIVSTDDEKTLPLRLLQPWELPPPEYTVPRGLFSCAALRSLSIGPCRLSPPATVSLPSIEELLLTHVSDEGKDVQRLISACPRLADLTLEACDTVTALSLLNMRLRRLALRCCHKLASVAVDASELQAFEYRGAVPENSFLTMRGGSRWITSCKVDICGQVASSVQELIKFREFLQLFADTKHLHLQSARLGSGVENGFFPAFSSLRHLELRGRLPHDDAAIVGAITTILEHAPNLEVLSLFFEPDPHDDESRPRRHYDKEEKLLDAHHLMYNRHDVPAAPSVLIPCSRSRVREINLVHYQGGRAQRTLAKFLLRNAPAIAELWCGFAEGPLWIQTKLMREIKGWLMNDKANANFS